jgi:hypothetical protein
VALPARIPRSRAIDSAHCTVRTGGSVHEPVHDLLGPLVDSDYITSHLASKPREVVALAINVYSHLSLARPIAMLPLADQVAGRTHDVWSSNLAAAMGSMMLDQICSSGATARSGMA